MKTEHNVHWTDARELTTDQSWELVVTSPPYPGVDMWEDLWRDKTWEERHEWLRPVWETCVEGLCDGGIIAINIGDATVQGDHGMEVLPNHVRISEIMRDLGMTQLPSILWKKSTLSPTSFMGSGMRPPNAYPTQEHEHILLFRKGSMRDPENRDQSAYFWTERNRWFSETWDIRGETQSSDVRDRSAAYPLEIPLTLIRMFSVQGDTVFDPFWGTGTTTAAAMLAARNSLGVEINDLFREVWSDRLENLCQKSREHQENRVRSYLNDTQDKDKPYYNENLGIQVMTQDEQEMRLPIIDQWDTWSCEYTWLDASDMMSQDTFRDF